MCRQIGKVKRVKNLLNGTFYPLNLLSMATHFYLKTLEQEKRTAVHG